MSLNRWACTMMPEILAACQIHGLHANEVHVRIFEV
jgi:hypothetical protein